MALVIKEMKIFYIEYLFFLLLNLKKTKDQNEGMKRFSRTL